MRGKEGEKKREKGEAAPCSAYIRGNIAHKNVHAPFSYSSCSVASSFFSSSIASSFTFYLPSLLHHFLLHFRHLLLSRRSRLRTTHHRRTGEKEKKKESTPDCDRGARRRTMTAADYARGTGGTGRKGGGKGKRETDARRPEREEGTRDGKSEREVREDGVRMVCQDIAETERATRQKRFGALLAASRRVEKPEAPGKTRFPN